jgi:hypothetical protein
MRWLVSVLLCAVAACGETDRDAELKAFVEAAVGAAQSRDTGHFRDVIASSYRDNRGVDRERAIDLVRGFFFVNPQIEADADIEGVVWDGTDSARLTLDLDVTGRSNRYEGTVEFELLRIGGDWQVIGARWDDAQRRAPR